MANLLHNTSSFLGIAGAIVAIITALVSAWYQRRQAQIMESQVDRQIEVKITRDLEAPESAINSELRLFVSKRLGDVRGQMRQEFGQRLDDIDRMLAESHIMERRDIAEDSLRVLSDQKDAMEIVKASNGKLNTLNDEMKALQQVVEDIRQGVGNQAMVRAQIRGIAEQLLRMTNQE